MKNVRISKSFIRLLINGKTQETGFLKMQGFGKENEYRELPIKESNQKEKVKNYSIN